jgi:hypothetical protein
MGPIELKVEQMQLDTANPRLEGGTTQRAILQQILDDQGEKSFTLAEDIATEGTSPMDRMLVLREKGGKYVVRARIHIWTHLDYYTHRDHELLAQLVRDRVGKQRWVATYDNVRDIRKLHAGCKGFTYQLDYSARTRRTGSELMYFCDQLQIPATAGLIQGATRSLPSVRGWCANVRHHGVWIPASNLSPPAPYKAAPLLPAVWPLLH